MIPEGYEICDLDDAEKILYFGHVCEFIKHTERGHGDLSHQYIVSLPDCRIGKLYDYEIRDALPILPIRKIKDSEPEPEPHEVSDESAIATEMVKEYMKIFQGFGGKNGND